MIERGEVTKRLDVIGDVHGQYEKLTGLLRHLGYRDAGQGWRHPERTAVFVGDLIDRGPRQLATLELVRDMVNAGAAHCVLGNHEFNAVAWVTADPRRAGRYLRDHDEPGNALTHRAFLEELDGTPDHARFIAWFKTLPLWLDFGGLRIVHACWHEPSMAVLRPVLTAGHALTDTAIDLGNWRGHPVNTALEVVCKGPEVSLPPGLSFQDAGAGKIRQEVRVRWWLPELSTYREAAIGPPIDVDAIPDGPLPRQWVKPCYEGVPVVFGHYWFKGRPSVISPRFACVDYSAAKSGPLVAYRWDGEPSLSSLKFAWVQAPTGDGSTSPPMLTGNTP